MEGVANLEDCKGFEQSVKRVYRTSDNELDCEALQALLPRYIDAEIAGGDAAKQFPEAKAHLDQCPDCAEEYAGLRQIAKLEARGSLPEAEDLFAQFPEEPQPEIDGTTTTLAPQPDR